MIELIREDPPSAATNATHARRLNAWLGELRHHQAEWFRWPGPVSVSIADAIRNGARRDTVPREFEVATKRNPGTHRRTMWVRWIGQARPEVRIVAGNPPEQPERIVPTRPVHADWPKHPTTHKWFMGERRTA